MPHSLDQDSQAATSRGRLIGFTLLLMSGMVLLEVLFVALTSGHLPNRITSTLFANLEFFAVYLLEAPGATLELLLIEKPLFEIASVQVSSGLDVWRLSYFNYANLVHLVLAVLLARRWRSMRDAGGKGVLLFGSGAVLLAGSSLYLFHTSCCTGGPLWIVHTGLLASIFNPVTATVARLDIYAMLHPWLNWLQVGFALTGLLLLGKFLHSSRQ